MYLYQSNRLENLFAALCKLLADPLTDPLAAEIIVVQNPGMARWLSQHIALQTGITANLSFPLPATFIWKIFEQTLGELPELTSFARDVLLWRILPLLDALSSDPAMAGIGGYLHDDRDGSRRFQLAGRIADLFDQYLVYRPQMLLAWEKGKEHHWQAVLWRKLTADHGEHRAALLQRYNNAAVAGKLNRENLPERISFFGINALAPAYLSVIAHLSRLTDIHVFQLSPCRQAWDDILPERLLALKRQSWRNQGTDDISSYFTSGNPLLASMGATGREFFSQLMQLDVLETDLYETPEQTSLLTKIQSDILDLRDRGRESRELLDTGDTSIRFHCCHSPMREVQVLHDRLLDLFGADPTLKPADILVMAPDINQYAPAVTGVFGSARGELYIPWSIADQSRRVEQPVIDGFLGLLALISSRFTAPEVVAVLENPAVLRKLGLSDNDFGMLRSRIMDAGICWGLDREQRMKQGMDDSPLHTWQFGLERLLMGYVTGPLDGPLLNIVPCGGLPAGFAPWLGALASFISNLQELQRRLRTPCNPVEWKTRLSGLMDLFFKETSSDQDGLLMLRETINDFAAQCETAGFTGLLDLAVIRRHLEQQLAEPAGGQAFLTGKVTFCNMVPMRSVPFTIIWLLGMNDMDYPRTRKPPAFDLIADKPCLGDRSRRDDDRYLFLEALLSARKELSISWVGRDQKENTELPPSVVVAELRDYIDRGWQSADKQPVSTLLTIEYPLQPFSRRCFDGTPATASYGEAWLPKSGLAQESFFIIDPLPEPDLQQVDIRDLVRFWNHPVRFFLEQRVGLRTRGTDDLLPESEPFNLDPLQRYLLTEEIVDALRTGNDPAMVFLQMEAAGRLPRAEIGRHLFEDITSPAASLVETLAPYTCDPAEDVEIDLALSFIRITGRLGSLYNSGRISFRPATLKPKDLLQVWLHHLVLCLLRPEGIEPVSIHASTDTMIRFRDIDDPEAELESFVHCFLQGQSRPLHFYPRTSHAWAKSGNMSAAERTWYSGYRYTGEEDDPAYGIALRGHDPLDKEFCELATLFVPVLEHQEELHAAA